MKINATWCFTFIGIIVPPLQQSPSVHPSDCRFVCLWTELRLLCIFHNTSQIHIIYTHLINQLHKMCHVLRFLKNSKIRIWGYFFKFVNLTLYRVHVMWMLKFIPHLGFYYSHFGFTMMIPFYPAALKAPGYCRTPSGRAGGRAGGRADKPR